MKQNHTRGRNSMGTLTLRKRRNSDGSRLKPGHRTTPHSHPCSHELISQITAPGFIFQPLPGCRKSEPFCPRQAVHFQRYVWARKLSIRRPTPEPARKWFGRSVVAGCHHSEKSSKPGRRCRLCVPILQVL